MSKPLEDYGFIGNAVSAALVARDGSIDWLCLPHFDSPACFAALLGDYEHGHWQIEPAVSVRRVRRRYRPGTAVLETTFETARGTVTLIDFMPFTDDERYVDVVRVVRGDRGRVPMRMRLTLRFDYGRVVPWVRRQRYGISAVAGPDALQLRTPVPLVGRNMHTEADFDVEGGSEVPFTLAWHPSHLRPRRGHDEAARLAAVTRRWQTWSQDCTVGHPIKPAWHEALTRSLVTLKSLTYAPTGGIVAAPTTSLPEEPGGERNWDYRLCWIRDATLTLYALLTSGYRYEARAWRDWLLRAAAGDPAQLRVLYGLNGTQRLPELELQWLPGYADSRPVRVGNAAQDQYQLDVPGELMDTLHVGRRLDLAPNRADWDR
jgi:GH15 family glucan-1,4-alpha-glucosidase